MDETCAGTLCGAVREVLETMFFTDPVGEWGHALADPITVQVSFAGPPDGCLELLLSKRAAGLLAGNFLGMEEECTEEQTCEVACEAANMICGLVLSRTGAGALFRLGSPRLTNGEEPGGRLSAACCFELEAGEAGARLYWDRSDA